MTIATHYARHAGIAALFVAAALLGTLAGVLFAYSDDLPEVSALDNYSPNTITRVLGRDNQLVGEFAVERRVVIHYDDIPENLRQAILAAEDGDFFQHAGLSISRMMLALVRDVVSSGRVPGGSTLTQQLARNLFATNIGFTTGDRSWERKIKESLVAVQIEKRYTKPEIFTMYCNQIYFGHGAYGVEAASQLYFRKPAKDLALEEAATIAGIIQGNVRQSPFVNPEATRRRRNYALDRMAVEGFITDAVATETKEKPIVVAGDPVAETSQAPYFLEEVRKHLEASYGAKALYESGLTVRTALDLRLQQAANRAIDQGLRRVDKRRGFRKPRRNVVAEGRTVDNFKHDRWARRMAAGDIVPAIVRSANATSAQLRIGALQGELTKTGITWTRRTSPAELFKAGDLIDVELTTVEGGTASVTLEQTPVLEGALVAIDNHTGQVLAMVGGYSFGRSKFNRATQAYRQMGSTVKPILYTAAIDRGLTPTTILVDEPTSFDAGTGQPAYQPRNYDRKFAGRITLRHALEQSRNIPSVKIIEMLGPSQVASYAKKFGFAQEFRPFLSMALGAQEVTLMEITSAFSAFPNHGIRMQPFLAHAITDRDGGLLEETRPQPKDAIRADTAYVMTNLLQGVVQRGTSTAALALKWPLAGKTGTVDDNTDAWFIGFDPNITVGVWIGHDEKKPIGGNETGATAALPMWIDFMRTYLDLYADREHPPTFDPPGNIVFMTVDRDTGDVTSDANVRAIHEAFISGTQPSRQ
ncbi:MAG: penicillin-binding protein [Acidobacterium sp.]|nr:PBP1A family penicillin-binding protein [Acidobacteriota bacterium]PHY12244.1 MAG: penicillin-binding protein [Acidobacterium sp.]